MADTARRLERRFFSLHRRYGLSPSSVRAFRELIYHFYRTNRRAFPWRRTRNPYRILVSEFMLQQTQTARVETRYGAFLRAFPRISALAKAPAREVLSLWQGLGYNRRALALRNAARMVVERHGGRLPRSPDELVKLPGVGKATAAALSAFAYGEPRVLVETNIRRVFIHYFFRDREGVRDTEIAPVAAAVLDREDPRNWYYALMDHGVYLRKHFPNANRRSAHYAAQSPFEGSSRQLRGSAHYAAQSPFEGSSRQLRGKILRALVSSGGMTRAALAKAVGSRPEKVHGAVAALVEEGFLRKKGMRFTIA
jgi:A/G-specific adenine glycosylase